MLLVILYTGFRQDATKKASSTLEALHKKHESGYLVGFFTGYLVSMVASSLMYRPFG